MTRPTGAPKGRPRKQFGKGNLPLPEDITPEMLEKVPAAPSHFMDDGAIMWHQIFAYGNHFLGSIDRFLVQETCEIYEEKEFLRRKVTIEGKRTYNYKGQELAHPYVAQLKDARAQLHSKLSSIGFDLSVRQRLAIDAQNEAEDAFEKLARLKIERDRVRQEQQALYAAQLAEQENDLDAD